METINKVFEAETVEEILQKLAADNSEFAQKHLATLKKMVRVYFLCFQKSVYKHTHKTTYMFFILKS